MDPVDLVDQRVILHDIRWEDYGALLKMRGDRAGVRVWYLDGELEFLSPSYPHESIKTTIAMLVEAWAVETKTDIIGAGSWTVRRKGKKRGAEPDECYILGVHKKPAPDLAIEVIWTSGGLDKLDIYRGLRVREVWVWRDGVIEVYALGRKAYERVARSTVLPKLNLEILGRYASAVPSTGTVRKYLAALRRSLRRRRRPRRG